MEKFPVAVVISRKFMVEEEEEEEGNLCIFKNKKNLRLIYFMYLVFYHSIR